LTSQYGPRNKSHHDGVDIAAPVGTLVVAAAPGEVIYSGVLRGYGKVIIVRHGKGYASVYAHNSVNHVKQGQVVKQGQKLAEVGKTGRATGPNLHFEIRRNNKAQNPLKFLPPHRRVVSR
jgi:murein DD-endopeptidase MepM/ murein hydrolase activator NlpD